jgi:beta-lactamase superfamily II metal-dependent hydrolase
MPVALDNDEGRAKSRAVANQGSYIIHIKCGKFEGLFLGDAPCFRTEQVLSMREPYDAEIIFLKVAHHGSDDGTNRSLIERLCDAVPSIATRYAMITPFKHHKLPRIETIELLKEHSFQVRTSGAHDSEEIRNKIYKDFKFITNAAMSEATSPGGDIIAVRFANL